MIKNNNISLFTTFWYQNSSACQDIVFFLIQFQFLPNSISIVSSINFIVINIILQFGFFSLFQNFVFYTTLSYFSSLITFFFFMFQSITLVFLFFQISYFTQILLTHIYNMTYVFFLRSFCSICFDHVHHVLFNFLLFSSSSCHV